MHDELQKEEGEVMVIKPKKEEGDSGESGEEKKAEAVGSGVRIDVRRSIWWSEPGFTTEATEEHRGLLAGQSARDARIGKAGWPLRKEDGAQKISQNPHISQSQGDVGHPRRNA